MAVKPRVLIVSDTPAINSGMGIGHKHIAQRLHDTGKYEVASFGWFWHTADAKGLKWTFPWKQFTNTNYNRPYGHYDGYPEYNEKNIRNSALGRVIYELFKPNVVIGLGDFWMLDFLYTYKNRNFKFIHEIPIDGEPVPKSWVRLIKGADVLISMSEYGKRVIQDVDKHCSVEVIPRGIDVTEFYKINAPKEEIKKQYMPAASNRFVVGFFDRFQDRKQIGRTLESFYKFISDGKHPDCDLYLHTDVNDAFSIQQQKTLLGEDGLIERYGIKTRIIINKDISVEAGVPVDVLNGIYNCCDVKVSTTQGEGWGLTTAEAMLCGVPCIGTNYTTMPELLGSSGERGLLADVKTYITGMYNIERALVDTTHVAKLLDYLYRSPKLRDHLGKASSKYIRQFRWDTIIKRWERIIDECLQQSCTYNLIDDKKITSSALKEVNIYGAVKENTGWAITTRGMAKGLLERDWEVNITEGGGSIPGFKYDDTIKSVLNKPISRNYALINHLPSHAIKIAKDCNAKYKAIYFPYELDHITYDIVSNVNRLSDIYLCPTTFVENVAKKSGVLNTAIVPLASDIDTKAEPAVLKTKKSYKFLMLGNLGDTRKYVHIVIKAFISSFTDKDDVCLILKSQPGHQNSNPEAVVEWEKRGRLNTPEVIVIHENDEDVAKYYAACDCLLMPSHCEGWGHPVFEALKFGMPIIASNYGGYLDFIHKGKNIQLIDGNTDLAKNSPNFFSTEKWFELSYLDFCGALKKAYSLDMRKTGEDYVKEYTWQRTAEAIENAFDKIDKRKKTTVYFERMVKNLWNRDNEIGFKSYAPINYEFTTDSNISDFQIIDITRISDKYYINNEKYIVLFHCFGEWSEENPSEYYDLFKNAMFVYSHIDLASLYPTLDSHKFMRGPWGVQPDLWRKIESNNSRFEILCTGEIASTEGIEECIAACDMMNTELLHVGNNLRYTNKSYINKSKLTQDEMMLAYNDSKWVSALRRIEGFEKPAMEGLLCGARPICFDTPLYRYWYGDLARYVKEGTHKETSLDLINVMKTQYAPISIEEREKAIKRFSWVNVSKRFWDKVNEARRAQ